MRKFIRHPVDIPIKVTSARQEYSVVRGENDIGFGGLRFQTTQPLQDGTLISIHVDIVNPPAELPARVVWCRQIADKYEVGVEFIDKHDAFRARMVEQVCYIHNYRKEVLQQQGRHLSTEQAAQEWIARHAGDFPAL